MECIKIWVILFISISAIGITKAGVIKNKVEEVHKTPKLIFLKNGTDLWRIKGDEEKGFATRIIKNNVTNFDLDQIHERIFWHDANGNFYCRSIPYGNDFHHSEIKFLFNYYKRMEPFHVPSHRQPRNFPFSYDSFTDKLYVADNELNKIVILDLASNFLSFITDWSPNLNKAIGESQAMKKISLDPEAGLMYVKITYENSTQKMFKSNMDGTDTTEVDIRSGPEGLYECKYPGTVCNSSKPINLEVNFFNVESVKILQSDPLDLEKNNCAKPKNGGCEHFCLLNSSKSPSCACSYGYKSSSKDKKKCTVMELTRPRRQGGYDNYQRQGYYDMYSMQSTLPPPPTYMNQGNQFLPMYILYPIGKR